MITKNLANAIIDMDNIAFNEGLGPKTKVRADDWEVFVDMAEEATGKRTHRHRSEARRKKST
jgi:hypothetical protein